MDATDTLLTILITILSVVIVLMLIVITVVFVMLRKLINKAQRVADLSSQNMALLRNQLLKKAGIFGALRFLLKR